MGILKNDFSDEYTPVCNICGVYLCYDISEQEYSKRPEFWDNWLCKDCVKEVVPIVTSVQEWNELKEGRGSIVVTMPFTRLNWKWCSIGYASIRHTVGQKEKLIKPISTARDGDIIKIKVGG